MCSLEMTFSPTKTLFMMRAKRRQRSLGWFRCFWISCSAFTNWICHSMPKSPFTAAAADDLPLPPSPFSPCRIDRYAYTLIANISLCWSARAILPVLMHHTQPAGPQSPKPQQWQNKTGNATHTHSDSVICTLGFQRLKLVRSYPLQG